MDGWVVGTSLACLLVSVLGWALQRYVGHGFGTRVATELGALPLAAASPLSGSPDDVADPSLAVWQKRLYEARAAHLETIRSVAGKWRDAFVGLLGLFGAVLALAGTSAFADVAAAARRPLFAAVMVTLVLALNATFYTGWAATGGTWSGWARLATPEELRDEQNAHAGRSLFRLRLGLVYGGFALVGAVGALGVAMASQLPR